MKVGILGAGQLGRMLAMSGLDIGVEVSCFETSTPVPASAVAAVTVGDPADVAAVTAFASGVDVVTVEVEGMPAASLRGCGRPVWPPVDALEVAADRLAEKTLLASLGIPTTRTLPASSAADLAAAFAELGPCLVKTRTGGYDGRGQVPVRSAGDLVAAEALLVHGPGVVVEQLVDLDTEVSIVAARDQAGTVVAYPLIENTHRDGILRVSRVPARVPAALEAEALGVVSRLLAHLDYVGVLTLELFVSGGRLLANEIAPRVHNSGHLTIEAAETSQFEQHLRAITGLPLGSTALRGPAAMVNLIGVMPAAADILAVPSAHLHDYAKQPRPARKLGHVTVTAPDEGSLDARLEALLALVADS